LGIFVCVFLDNGYDTLVRTRSYIYLPCYFYYFNNIITCNPKGSYPPSPACDKLIASVTRTRQCPSVYSTNTIYNIPLGGVYNNIPDRLSFVSFIALAGLLVVFLYRHAHIHTTRYSENIYIPRSQNSLYYILYTVASEPLTRVCI